MAISKSSKSSSAPEPKARTAGASVRKHPANGDQPTRIRATAAGTAKPAAGRSSAPAKPRKKAARGLTHKSPSRGRQPATDASGRDGLLMPVAVPSPDLLREVELIINRGHEVTIVHGKTSVRVTGATLAAMRQIIAALSAGPLSLVLGDTQDTELTSQEVADLLNVSRPFVVKLAREGRIAHKMVGNRHRFLLSDVRAYEQAQRLEREQALASLVPEGGYSDEDF
jgi:excisionase family DNA binding protein